MQDVCIAAIERLSCFVRQIARIDRILRQVRAKSKLREVARFKPRSMPIRYICATIG